MDEEALEDFLLKARTKTYASGGGSVPPLLSGSKQLEYAADGWLYRDVYYVGNGIFPGLETVYFHEKPVWSMSYFGDFSKMTEKQADTMLRKALVDNWETTRAYKNVRKDYEDFTYFCEGSGSMDSLEGFERIEVDSKQVYFFYYAGGLIG